MPTRRGDEGPRRWLPGAEELDHGGPENDSDYDGHDRGAREYQVGIRLFGRHYERLVRAADLYGVAPTTLARMLINRGSKAIIQDEMRERMNFKGWEE